MCISVWDDGDKIDENACEICFKTVKQDGNVIFDYFTDKNRTKTRYTRNQLNVIE